MHTTHLRKVGGSTMLSIPPALLELLELKAGQTVSIDIKDNQLLIQPIPRPSFTLEQLLAQCEPSAPSSPEEELWLSDTPTGTELL